MHDHADCQAEELVDLAHPFGVALGEIIVHGDDVHAAAGECIEIDRKSGDQRLAFAGLHFGDLAFVQNHAADALDIEVALPERTFGRLADSGECRHQNVVEALPLGQLLLECVGARTQRLVRQRFQFGFQRIDVVDARAIGADPAVVRGTEELAGDSADHRIILWNPGLSGRFDDNTIFPEIRFRCSDRAVIVSQAAQT